MTVEIREKGDSLVIDDRLVSGPRLEAGENWVKVAGTRYEKKSATKPAPSPARWDGLIGEYGWDHDVLYILEKDGKLHALIEWFFDYPLKEVGPDRFVFPDDGLYAGEGLIFTRDAAQNATQVEAASVVFKRRHLDGEGGKTFRIQPRRSVDADPPRGPDRLGRRSSRVEFRRPDLVELITLDPTIKLDIRYATTNNFLGVPFYTSARAFMERPAAEALVRAHRSLAKKGYGLLIHDAYRPWQVTKLFWEATPDSGRIFVADPAKGLQAQPRGGRRPDALRAGDGQAGEDGRRLRRDVAPVVSRIPRRHVTRALAPRAPARGHGGAGLHGQRTRVVALRSSRMEGVPDHQPCDSRTWAVWKERSNARRSGPVSQVACWPTSQSGQSRRMASLAARASRAKVRISVGSATQPSSGSRATRSKACRPTSSSGRSHRSASSASSLRRPRRLAHLSGPPAESGNETA